MMESTRGLSNFYKNYNKTSLGTTRFHYQLLLKYLEWTFFFKIIYLNNILRFIGSVIFLVINFRKICVNVKNRCIDLNTGSFKSLDQAAKELKLGTLKIEHLELYPFDFQRLLCHFKTYCNGLKVSTRNPSNFSVKIYK